MMTFSAKATLFTRWKRRTRDKKSWFQKCTYCLMTVIPCIPVFFCFFVLFYQIYLVIDEIRRFQKDVYNFQEVGQLFILFYCVNILCTQIF